MSQETKIAWCDSTFNPWIGCTKVSPGCANCYAERDNGRRKWVEGWGKGIPRKRTSAALWKLPLRWNAKAQSAEENWIEAVKACAGYSGEKPRRPRVFCGSLCDWLDDEVPIEWLADLLQLIANTPNLDWLLLTKRPENWSPRLAAVHKSKFRADTWTLASPWSQGEPPQNVWIGTTVENQEMANQRIPELLKIPAKVRFLSCEPLLGMVNIRGYLMDFVSRNPGMCGNCGKTHGFDRCPNYGGVQPTDKEYGCNQFKRVDFAIHWVICGGESGPKARPMHPDWARSLRDQCKAAGVPFLFKQWGEWLPQYQAMQGGRTVNKLQVHDFGGGIHSHRVGKKAAGRRLDGVEHNEFPQP